MKKPLQALFSDNESLPIIASCEHFAGSEKLIRKAFELQNKVNYLFDITCDCEDGAQAGKEKEQVEMISSMLLGDDNLQKRAGIRIHDPASVFWQQDVDIVLREAGNQLAYITIPKATSALQVMRVAEYIQIRTQELGLQRAIPLHILIETHGALREVNTIAQTKNLQVLDFGLMDFVSAHQGAIHAKNMRSPGQFTHNLLRNAKTQVVAAALAHSVIPSHNVTLDLKNSHQTYNDALRAKEEFGFMRMWSIYPTQIQAIVEAMQPSYAEIIDAENILLAAQKNDWGPIQYAGELHDRATYRYFWALLQRAKMSGRELQAQTLTNLF